MSGRPPGVKVGDRVRLTVVHTGTVTEIDDHGFVIEPAPGRPMHGSFHGDGEMTWEVQRPEPPIGTVVLDTTGLAWQRSNDAPLLVALGDVTPLATDEQRLAAGWLDPTGVEIVWAARDRAIAERDEARARLNEVSNDRLAQQLRRFAVEQPVITAARAWRAGMKLAEAAMANDSTWKLSPVSAVLADAIDALDAATETPPC